MKRLYDKENNRLVYQGTRATSQFWDALWQKIDNMDQLVARGAADPLVRRTTSTYLPAQPTVRVLEGGCGFGQHVAGLQQLGYDAYGIDYAPETVTKINARFPHLNVQLANITQLPFADNFFDGYWSLGVIEHFYHGFDAAAREMQRVVRPGGYLFITIPHMSWLRRIKASLGAYSPFQAEHFNEQAFYQFALDATRVIQQFELLGFSLVAQQPVDGIKGLKDELTWLQPVLSRIYNSRRLPLRIVKVGISLLAAPFTSHCTLLVLKKTRKNQGI